MLEVHIKIEAVMTKFSIPVAILGVGIPGSDKTSALAQTANILDFRLISVDDIRQELAGNTFNRDVTRRAWELAYLRSAETLARAGSVIVDATHAQAWRRPAQIERYRSMGANTVGAVFFPISPLSATARIAGRERQVPEHVVYSMAKSLRDTPPSVKEGLDFVIELGQT